MSLCGRCTQPYSRCLCVHTSARQFNRRYLLRCGFCDERGHDIPGCIEAPRHLRFDVVAGEYVRDRSRSR